MVASACGENWYMRCMLCCIRSATKASSVYSRRAMALARLARPWASKSNIMLRERSMSCARLLCTSDTCVLDRRLLRNRRDSWEAQLDTLMASPQREVRVTSGCSSCQVRVLRMRAVSWREYSLGAIACSSISDSRQSAACASGGDVLSVA